MLYIGKAGWSLRKEHKPRFPAGETHLHRYARRLPAVEINSSFRNWHRPSTYARWADSVPKEFRFAVKVHQSVTHKGHLEKWEPMERFLNDTQNLGQKLGVYLVQLPPSHAFQKERAASFFKRLRENTGAEVVCEPRHESWFREAPDRVLRELKVGRVAADPPPAAGADKPGGWEDVTYYRLHGSPEMYYDSYSEGELSELADKLRLAADDKPVWCIFDNTARGAGTANALYLWGYLGESRNRLGDHIDTGWMCEFYGETSTILVRLPVKISPSSSIWWMR